MYIIQNMKMNIQNWKISKQVIGVEDQLPKERILDYTDQEEYVADTNGDGSSNKRLKLNLHAKYENELTRLEDFETGD